MARLNYFAFIVREYDISPAHYFNAGFLTSAVLPIGLADLANNIFNASSRFDIRFAGAIHSLLFLTALALFAAGTGSWGLAQRVVTRLLAILIFTDVSYAAFFNSFYSEPSSMVFLPIALSAAILAWSSETPGRTMVFVSFYPHHPAQLWDLLNREAKSTLGRRPLLGNFERRPGLVPGAQTTSFSKIGRLLMRISPRSAAGVLGFFVLVAAGTAAIWIRTRSSRVRLGCELIAALAAVGASQFVLVAVTQGQIDTIKHMFLTRLIFDMLVLALVACTLLPSRRTTLKPAAGHRR